MKTTAEIYINEGDEEIELTLNLEFDWQPYEPEVRYYPDGSGYPGCPAQATLYDAACDNPIFEYKKLSQSTIEDLENKCFESMEKEY